MLGWQAYFKLGHDYFLQIHYNVLLINHHFGHWIVPFADSVVE